MKMSHKGLKWWTNGVVEILSKEQPEGFTRGRKPKYFSSQPESV